MQKEQIDRFVTLAGLEMPALISPGKFQEAEIYEDSAVLTFLLPKVYPLEELIDELDVFLKKIKNVSTWSLLHE